MRKVEIVHLGEGARLYAPPPHQRQRLVIIFDGEHKQRYCFHKLQKPILLILELHQRSVQLITTNENLDSKF